MHRSGPSKGALNPSKDRVVSRRALRRTRARALSAGRRRASRRGGAGFGKGTLKKRLTLLSLDGRRFTPCLNGKVSLDSSDLLPILQRHLLILSASAKHRRPQTSQTYRSSSIPAPELELGCQASPSLVGAEVFLARQLRHIAAYLVPRFGPGVGGSLGAGGSVSVVFGAGGLWMMAAVLVGEALELLYSCGWYVTFIECNLVEHQGGQLCPQRIR